MSAGLRTGNLRAARPHCTCVEVRNYDYDAAAVKLGCKRRFLEDRIRQLPHQKIGESVAFCDCDLRLIQAMCTVIPDQIRSELSGAEPEVTPQPAGRRSLRDVRPAGARRRKAEPAP
ncbi:hypothetical protein GR925_25730 [Streptomyces sp. HUCO-GS316]|uniref:hypothetical protein n=1 Tax=Streptomyces sp. HUCO-GS316 TaxID=2692198 RepID=UPI00136CE096|nr:hypothetical protein [Streptomyces sp. HUCO-GS316]MXM66737.1 hypothetical protein [Streptomyces sp. HUCO-GS316]